MARPKVDPRDKVVNMQFCAPARLLDYVLTWQENDKHTAFIELLEDMQKLRPAGRYSRPPVCTAEQRSAPGTKTWYKRELRAKDARIAELEKQVAKLGGKV